MKAILEVCIQSPNEAQIAESAGADRFELNSALQLGGLTPSPASFIATIENVSIPVIAMARPRAGGFCYSESDWNTLVQDAKWMVENGAAGIAFGCLTSERLVDINRVCQLRELLGDQVELVFHRAFDLLAQWEQAVDDLAKAGVQRIMTSGFQTSVPEGLSEIRQIVDYANGRIEVIPAGGVTPCNMNEVIKATGCCQAHGTFSSGADDPGYESGPFRFADNDQLRVTNPDKVQRAKTALIDAVGA